MIAPDVAAPVLLLLGLSMTPAANASLLNNFEIVATALIALCVFRETISPRLWGGIAFVTAACALLSFEDMSALHLSAGSLLILGACVCWGIENNCTRRLSAKDPLMIVLLKGIFSGAGSVVIGLCLGQRISSFVAVPATLAAGFVAYGLSIFFYVYAQRMLGAAVPVLITPSRPSSAPLSPSPSSVTHRPPPIWRHSPSWRSVHFWRRGMSPSPPDQGTQKMTTHT